LTKRKRKALGKGMDAIFPGIETEESSSVREIEIEKIDPNPFQPRKEWNREEILSLAHSISSQGIIQPLIVRQSGTSFQLIAGERRLRAAKEAGLSSVPVVVRDADDREMLALALVENIQRKDLGPIEKAEAFSRLSKEFGLTQAEMGEQVGMSRSSVANFQRLLELPEKVIDMLRDERLTMGHGRALLGLNDKGIITRIATLSVKRSFSVRELEERVRILNLPPKRKPRTKNEEETVEIRKLQDSLQRVLKTKVRIRSKGSSGRIEISYHSLEELDRLLAIIRNS
jgi:ParB family transcriptional regulator, chromosome partitioning protein